MTARALFTASFAYFTANFLTDAEKFKLASDELTSAFDAVGLTMEDLAKAGLPDVRVEGMPHCDWVLIDAGDVIVHVFRPEVRAFYNLEKMWASGPSGERRPS